MKSTTKEDLDIEDDDEKKKLEELKATFQPLTKLEKVMELVEMLRNSSRGLAVSTVIGSPIDLAGAYKRNHKLDKAKAVLVRCARHAELKSGSWMVK